MEKKEETEEDYIYYRAASIKLHDGKGSCLWYFQESPCKQCFPHDSVVLSMSSIFIEYLNPISEHSIESA